MLQKPERLTALRERLAKDGITIEWEPHEALHAELSDYFGGVSQELREAALQLMKICHAYICKAVLTDHFDNDHDAQRRWRDEVIEEFPEFECILLHTKLSVNSFQAIYGYLDMFLRKLESSAAPPQLKALMHFYSSELPQQQIIAMHYKDMSQRQKL